jgi:16S rRNA (adenine1518-N6/adenine1519-N6)-dimethyltransferase
MRPSFQPRHGAAIGRPKKSLGQNFLRSDRVAAEIVAQAGIAASENVLEIGPGLGALTVPLARAAHRVVAIEKDGALARRLEERLRQLAIDNVSVLNADVLRLDLSAPLGASAPPWVVIANLPYYISTSVLLQLIACRRAVARAVLMFQKEFAQRLCAQPGGREYGRITVLLAYHAAVRSVMSLAAHEFRPRPAIDSRVVEIRFFAQPPVRAADEPFFQELVRAAFNQRRKSIKNALEGGLAGRCQASVSAALAEAGIDPLRRAETLGIADFVRLAAALRPPVTVT